MGSRKNKKNPVKKERSETRAGRRELKRKVKKATFGVTDILLSAVLYSLYLSFSYGGGKGSLAIHRKFNKADELLEGFDGKKLREALNNLVRRGFITSLCSEAGLPFITKAGFERIESKFPTYDSKRVWDKKLYLINYDIPIRANMNRDLLREKLSDYKAVSLQDSLYLTPYNPREIVRYFIEKYQIDGNILISILDPDNAFTGRENIKAFLWEIYELEETNRGYSEFIRGYEKNDKKRLGKKRTKIAFEYMSVLQKDPQLPFDLLLDDYLGDKAYLLFKKLVAL